MNSKDYIISELKDFLKKGLNAHLRYEYDELSNVHFIEITPKSSYNDKEVKKWRYKLFDDFVEKYPNQNIGFISDDAIVPIQKVDFEIGNEPNMTIELKQEYIGNIPTFSDTIEKDFFDAFLKFSNLGRNNNKKNKIINISPIIENSTIDKPCDIENYYQVPFSLTLS